MLDTVESRFSALNIFLLVIIQYFLHHLIEKSTTIQQRKKMEVYYCKKLHHLHVVFLVIFSFLKKMEVYYCKKLHHLHVVFLVIFSFLVTISIAHVPTRFCGKIQIRTPFLNPSSTGLSSPLSRIILCKAEKLYFRTSIGLFQISSIDYSTKTLTISHSSSSSSKQYVSPSLLSAGFPPTPHPNSLLLFNCSNERNLMPPFVRNCSGLHVLHASPSKDIDHDSCLLVDDDEKLDKEFHPKDLKCSHYRRVHRRCLEGKEVEFGTKVSFDIPAPDHAPDICKECKTPNGNCGAALKCICHAKQCTDKVISLGGSLYSISSVLFSLLSSTAMMMFLIH